MDDKVILNTIGLEESDIERYRGCWIEDNKIVICARTGGANREYYPNSKLIKNPYYICDKDDDFDCTYAYYEFINPIKGGKEE